MTTATKRTNAVSYKIDATRYLQALDALEESKAQGPGYDFHPALDERRWTDSEWNELSELIQNCKDEANDYEIETLAAVARILDTMRVGETLTINNWQVSDLVFSGDVALLESADYDVFNLMDSATWTRTTGGDRLFEVEHGTCGVVTRVR